VAEDQSERGFTIVDRRGEEASGETPQAAASSESELPRADFSQLVLSLGTSTLYHLGLVGDPESGKPPAEPNLPLARQSIDILEMLEAKTQGNLDAEEAKLLEGILYELRMHFVDAGKKQPAPDSGEETGS
jgi:hypothetical protein